MGPWWRLWCDSQHTANLSVRPWKRYVVYLHGHDIVNEISYFSTLAMMVFRGDGIMVSLVLLWYCVCVLIFISPPLPSSSLYCLWTNFSIPEVVIRSKKGFFFFFLCSVWEKSFFFFWFSLVMWEINFTKRLKLAVSRRHAIFKIFRHFFWVIFAYF